jgi:hypothetical protein
MSFRKDFRIIFLREKIGFKNKLSKKVGGKATVRLSWRKGKWVATLAGAGRKDETGKEKQSGHGKLGPKNNENIEKCFQFPEFEV